MLDSAEGVNAVIPDEEELEDTGREFFCLARIEVEIKLPPAEGAEGGYISRSGNGEKHTVGSY